MQDFNYLSSNDFEITLELGCDKYPLASALAEEWQNNKNALIQFVWQVMEKLCVIHPTAGVLKDETHLPVS
jgi:hypothetical protein